MVYSMNSRPLSHQRKRTLLTNDKKDGQAFRILKLCWQPVHRQSEAEHFMTTNFHREKWSHIGGVPRLQSFGNICKLSDGFRGKLASNIQATAPHIAQALQARDRELRVLVFDDVPICKTLDQFPVHERPMDFLQILYRLIKCEFLLFFAGLFTVPILHYSA